MPTYCLVCPQCAHSEEYTGTHDALIENWPVCPEHQIVLRRDWGKEKAVSNFHPTRDVYALDLKRRAAKSNARHY
jgi:hypothetical protein